MNEPWCYTADEAYRLSIPQIALIWCKHEKQQEKTYSQADQQAYIRERRKLRAGGTT